MTFEDIIAEHLKGCTNGPAGKCQECDAAFVEAIRLAHGTRVAQLLVANNRHEQEGRIAKRVISFLENTLLDGTFGPTREAMARHLILEYRKDFPK